MSADNTIDAVRLALSLQEIRARTASANVANAGKPDATAQQVDFASVEAALRLAAHAGTESESAQWLADARRRLEGTEARETLEPIRLDEQVADIATAGVEYQALTESLSRRFGLMRLAISGKN